MQTPVRSSPAMIARSIGAAPRQRGSSEGWTLSIGELGEQRLADQLAEGADDDRLGPGGARSARSAALVVDVLGLQQLDPELVRAPRPPAAAAACRPRPCAAGRAG